MSRPINITSAVTVNIASFSGLTGSVTSGSTYPPSNGVNSSANTSTYAAFSGTSTTASGYVYYNFDTIEIPSNAVVNSVSCVARGRVNNTSRCYAAFQLYAGNTAKGSAVNFNTTTVTACTLTTGTWTASDFQNPRLCIIVRRAGNNQSGSARFYGATLTVNYSLNGTEYEVSFDNQSTDATTDPSTTQYVYQGGNQEIKIYIEDKDEIVVKDNNIDVGSSLVEIPESHNIAQVDSVAGASYGFAQDTQYGNYYKSQNGGVASSAAVCRLNITAETQCVLTVYFINYGEANWDFGIIGNLDSALATTSATTTNCKWNGSGNTNSADEQTVTFDITPGSHFVDFKYRKDTNTDSNYDALLFRYELEPGNEPHYYRYTISNIAADHTISIDDAAGGTYYTVNATSNYAGATVSPATKQVREGRSANVNIAVNNSYEIVVKDNGTTVTNSLVQNATGYTYTVSNVQAIHNITVEEAPYSTVSVSSTYAGATGTANPSKVYNGRDSVVEINVDHLYEIKVKDNNVDVTSSVVESQGESTNETFIPSEYVSSASSYDSVYNNNNPTNGVSDHTSTTRACVYSNTGSGAESKLTYKFNCSSIPENATITSVVCSAKTSVYQTAYFATRTVQLYHGDTAKGTATQITSTGSSGGNHNINGGSWTRSELNDISIVVLVTRSTSNPTSDASFSFWGATLRVDYTTPDGCFYTLTNVQGDHTIVVEEAPYYTISAANTYANASVSVSQTKVYSGSGVNSVVALTVPNLYEVVVRDGNTDITSSFVGSNGTYTYTLTNINANHTISVEEATKYLLTASSKYAGTTISPASSYVYSGQSITLTISGFSAKNRVKDNGTDVTSSLIQSGSNYLYTISNVSQTHEVVVYYEDNFIKVGGTFKQVRKYYKKVNGEWTEITSSGFNSEIENSILVYGGQQTGTTVIGEVVKSGSTVEILINDNALQSGSYKFVYEDETKTPLDNVDEIKEFTIS